MLLGEQLHQALLGDEAAAREHGAEPLLGAAVLAERLVELVLRDDALGDEQLAEPRAIHALAGGRRDAGPAATDRLERRHARRRHGGGESDGRARRGNERRRRADRPRGGRGRRGPGGGGDGRGRRRIRRRGATTAATPRRALVGIHLLDALGGLHEALDVAEPRVDLAERLQQGQVRRVLRERRLEHLGAVAKLALFARIMWAAAGSHSVLPPG